MKFLVTGATGFVGSWLVKKLLDEKHVVRVLHRPKSDLSELQGLSFESSIGDVTDASSVRTAAKGMDGVFHLAGVVGYSPAQRTMMEQVNVGGTANVIKACLENRVPRLVHMSSVVAVGASLDKTPLNESSPFNLHDYNLGYFETKLAAEKLVLDAVKQHRLNAVILNPSTIYGPGDARKSSRRIQLKVARGKFPFYTSGGVSIIHIQDCVNAICAAFDKGRIGERYILSGDNITIRELFQHIAAVAGVPPPSMYLPNFAVWTLGCLGDTLEKMGRKGPMNSESAATAIMFHWFDNAKAKNELGLNQRPARDAIADSVNWVRAHGWLENKA